MGIGFLWFLRERKRSDHKAPQNASEVTMRIAGFDVKRVMIDQESGAEIMYPSLYQGLGLTQASLSKYDTPLVAFNGSMVIPTGIGQGVYRCQG